MDQIEWGEASSIIIPFQSPILLLACQTLEEDVQKAIGINYIPHVPSPFMFTQLTCVGRQWLKYGARQKWFIAKKLRMGWELEHVCTSFKLQPGKPILSLCTCF